jgi:transposase
MLAGLDFPDPWRGRVLAALAMIDDLDRLTCDIDAELKALGADPRYIPHADDRARDRVGARLHHRRRDRRHAPLQLTPETCGYTGLRPRVYQSGSTDRGGHLTHAGPKYLRWALMEAAVQACRHPVYGDRYQRNKARLGRQRGAKVAQVDIARRLAQAIWHMLTRNQPFAPAGATCALAA